MLRVIRLHKLLCLLQSLGFGFFGCHDFFGVTNGGMMEVW
jgi:hypothetical protein